MISRVAAVFLAIALALPAGIAAGAYAPSGDELVAILDAIDVELDAGGLVYVHCWAGCGRTGVVVGSWLVRHGADPNDALRRIAETRGLGCPQTLEQRLVVLAWEAGR